MPKMLNKAFVSPKFLRFYVEHFDISVCHCISNF